MSYTQNSLELESNRFILGDQNVLKNILLCL